MNHSTVNIFCCWSWRRTPENQGANTPGRRDEPARTPQHCNQSSYTPRTNTASAARTLQYNETQGHASSPQYKIPRPSLSHYSETDLRPIDSSARGYGSTATSHRVVQTSPYNGPFSTYPALHPLVTDREPQEPDLPTGSRQIPHPFPSTSSDIPPENDQLFDFHRSTSNIYASVTSDHSPRTTRSLSDPQSSISSSQESEWDQVENSDLIRRPQTSGGTTSGNNLPDQHQIQNTSEPPQQVKRGMKQFLKQLKGKGKMVFTKLPVSLIPPWLNRVTKAQDQLEQLPHRNMPSFLSR